MPQANVFETSSSSSITQTAFSTGPGVPVETMGNCPLKRGSVAHSDPSQGINSESDEKQPQGSAVNPTTASTVPQSPHTLMPDTALEQTVPAPIEQDSPDPDASEPDAREQGTPEPDAPEPDAPEPVAPEPDAPEQDAPEPDAPEPDASTLDSGPTTPPEGTCDQRLMKVLWHCCCLVPREREQANARLSRKPIHIILKRQGLVKSHQHPHRLLPNSSHAYLRGC